MIDECDIMYQCIHYTVNWVLTAVTFHVPLELPLKLGANQRHFSFKDQKQESNFSWPNGLRVVFPLNI